VASIGPRLAVRALAAPVSRIAQAIEEGDLRALQALPGIGKGLAREIAGWLRENAAVNTDDIRNQSTVSNQWV
jgi:Holliday junction resolvasome RuvABC DNA-binding subunit